jgi:predicted metallopeptidase
MLVKYLEVVPDSRLTWREHVNSKVKKVHHRLWACRSAYGATLGLNPRVVYWLYISII